MAAADRGCVKTRTPKFFVRGNISYRCLYGLAGSQKTLSNVKSPCDAHRFEFSRSLDPKLTVAFLDSCRSRSYAITFLARTRIEFGNLIPNESAAGQLGWRSCNGVDGSEIFG